MEEALYSLHLSERKKKKKKETTQFDQANKLKSTLIRKKNKKICEALVNRYTYHI